MHIKETTQDNQPVLVPDAETEDLFEMANLYPGTTGLPMTIWVGPRGRARHDVRIKVNPLVDYWNGQIDTAGLIQALRALSAQPPSAP